MKVLILFALAVWCCHVVYGGVDPNCPPQYKRYSTRHTFCVTPNSSCPIEKRLVSKEDQELIVTVHNSLRSKIAKGGEKEKGFSTAGNMVKMVWDSQLADLAQKHADQCQFDHDCNECRQITHYHVGQNIYEMWTNANPDSIKPKWEKAINKWYIEINDFDAKGVSSFSDQDLEKIGHFTQIIWAKTHRIGCGFTQYPKDGFTYQLYVCDYGPGGNIVGEPLYDQSQSCSNCPNVEGNQACRDGLCDIGNQFPQITPPKGVMFYCTFTENDYECPLTTPDGMESWDVFDTYSGSYAEAVLSGGQETQLFFPLPFKTSETVCFAVKYRKGPNQAGAKSAGQVKASFQVVGTDHTFAPELTSDSSDFSTTEITLHYKRDFNFGLSFTVPPGAPDQYINLLDITVKGGEC